jgi:hypothetical protein
MTAAGLTQVGDVSDLLNATAVGDASGEMPPPRVALGPFTLQVRTSPPANTVYTVYSAPYTL